MGPELFDSLELYRAAQANDLSGLQRLAAVDVNGVQRERGFVRGLLDAETSVALLALQRTPLLAAAEAGHLEAVQLLLQAQAEVNYQDQAGFHALYLAAGSNVPELVSYLLSQGAELHARNRSRGLVRLRESCSGGYTALHNAVGCGARCIQVLLEVGLEGLFLLLGGPRGLEPQEPCGGGAGACGGGRKMS